MTQKNDNMPHWVHLSVSLPAHLGGFAFRGRVPRKVRDGILYRLGHKQFALAAAWLRRQNERGAPVVTDVDDE